MLLLLRRLNGTLAVLGLLANHFIRIEDRLNRYHRFAMLDRDNASAAKRLLSSLNLDNAARAKCQGANIRDEASPKIRRDQFRRSLAINSKGRINQGRHKGITDLNFSSQRYNRKANFTNRYTINRLLCMFFQGTKYTLRRAKIRVRRIT